MCQCTKMAITWLNVSANPISFVDSWIHIRAAKKSAIRRIAVREAGVSLRHGSPIKGPPETPWTITPLYRIEGLKKSPKLVPHYAERRYRM